MPATRTGIAGSTGCNWRIYGEGDRYRGISGGRRVIFLNEDDMRERGLRAGQWVDITSHFQDEERHAERFEVVPYPISRGSAAAYFPETNALVPVRSVAWGSNQPASKSVTISLAPVVAAQGQGRAADLCRRAFAPRNPPRSAASLSCCGTGTNPLNHPDPP